MIHEYRDYSLLKNNTFGFDVKAARFVEYETADELRELVRTGRVAAPYLHIGQGSNLLFRNDYEGVILHSRIHGIDVLDETDDCVLLRAGSGVVWDDFVAYCVDRNWFGVENLSGIPGEVGASAVQNIGAYGVEAKDLIAWVETIDMNGEMRTYPAAECDFSYRHSIFKESGMEGVFVTNVVYRLGKTEHYSLDYGTVREELKHFPAVSLKTVRQVICNIRAAKLPDPKVLGNAGSFFMNPIVPRARFEALKAVYAAMPHYDIDRDRVKIPAGWMIEQCGWKGKSLGEAAVHDKQALVLVNTGKATGNDVVALSDAVRRSVREKFGIDIHPEVKIIG